jgi:hypothetical protein
MANGRGNAPQTGEPRAAGESPLRYDSFSDWVASTSGSLARLCR